ncbi:antibiotic biosynthesis monooxygenase family protein [Streptomyces sp. NPDC013178]|uniref:antibiotic biosynthesis monooxygenase family protein n=1 Tax=Streptomyces sp. NPDC013178 TaxID=3155118 RepID=UPI0033C1A336
MTGHNAGSDDLKFFELDPGQDFFTQVGLDSGPCTLLDIVVSPPGAHDAVLEQWRRHADYMVTQPGFIRAQLHRSIGGDGNTIVNLAVWESPAALLAAVTTPEFAAIATEYPAGAVCTRQLMVEEAVKGICVA